MNLKLTNEVGGSQKLASKSSTASLSRIKEERQRTGRYIAILVGISLFMLAIYHAWVRRIPVVASLVVPALIMFIYVGWVLYTASREKRRNARALLDAEAAMNALTLDEENDLQNNNRDISVSSDSIKTANSPDEVKAETPKIETIKFPIEKNRAIRVKPIILINDEPPDDQDLIWPKEVIVLAEKNVIAKNEINKRRFRRRFCRSKKYAVFKRSYSIG